MKKMLLALFIFALGMMLTNDDVYGQTAGTVTIDSVTAQRGDQIAVGVRLDGNTMDISGLAAPIRYPQNALRLDSVSFLGSFISNDFFGVVDSFSFPNIIKISYLLTNYNPPVKVLNSPNGLLATLFFTVKNDAPPGNAPVDSVNIIDYVYIIDSISNPGIYDTLNTFITETNIQFASPGGVSTYYPDFKGGNIAVLVPTDIDDDITSSLPTDFSLAQNYPNPFNPTTVIGFSLPTASEIKLEIFNVLGQKVKTLASGQFSAGSHTLEFDASEHTSGIFFYRLIHENGVETKKMLLVK